MSILRSLIVSLGDVEWLVLMILECREMSGCCGVRIHAKARGVASIHCHIGRSRAHDVICAVLRMLYIFVVASYLLVALSVVISSCCWRCCHLRIGDAVHRPGPIIWRLVMNLMYLVAERLGSVPVVAAADCHAVFQICFLRVFLSLLTSWKKRVGWVVVWRLEQIWILSSGVSRFLVVMTAGMLVPEVSRRRRKWMCARSFSREFAAVAIALMVSIVRSEPSGICGCEPVSQLRYSEWGMVPW